MFAGIIADITWEAGTIIFGIALAMLLFATTEQTMKCYNRVVIKVANKIKSIRSRKEVIIMPGRYTPEF